MKHDAAKLKLLRETMGMTQEKLAILSSVSERTVQRAEAGASMSLETLNDFAAALEVPLSELVHDPEETGIDNIVALRRAATARTVFDDLGRATVAMFDCEFDPTPSELETVLALVSLIESRLPSPWGEGPEPLALCERIQLSASASAYLSTLSAAGIGLYSSTSWIMAKVPRYDMDEGHYYTHQRQPHERTMTLRLLLSRNIDDRIYRKPPASWGLDEESPNPAAFGFNDDDDVPF